jgi:hypothetical protein
MAKMLRKTLGAEDGERVFPGNSWQQEKGNKVDGPGRSGVQRTLLADGRCCTVARVSVEFDSIDKQCNAAGTQVSVLVAVRTSKV